MRGTRVHLGLAALAAGVMLSDPAFAASAASGKRAFMKAGCWQCHGTLGQGAVTGPRLAPDPMPYETFAAFVRTSSRAMPPYRKKVLSEADLADIYAYLQSVPRPPEVKSLPLLHP